MTPWSNPDASRTSTGPTRLAATPPVLERGALPPWESFPLADRRLLISVLVQTARRQIPSRPTPGRPGQGR